MNTAASTRFLPRLRLSRGADRRLQSGHLLIYSNEVDNQTTPLRSFEPGQQVCVENQQGRIVGTAYLNPNSLICGRLLNRDGTVFGAPQLTARLRAALQMREQFSLRPTTGWHTVRAICCRAWWSIGSVRMSSCS